VCRSSVLVAARPAEIMWFGGLGVAAMHKIPQLVPVDGPGAGVTQRAYSLPRRQLTMLRHGAAKTGFYEVVDKGGMPRGVVAL
jgi:hypothetical protein